MNIKHVHIVFLYLLLISVTNNKQIANTSSDVKIIQPISESIAGNPITLEFSSNNSSLLLYCSNSYSTTVLEPEVNSNRITFNIPPHFYKKRGTLNWKIIENGNTFLEDTILVLPAEKNHRIESYFGPPSIIAGGRDYAMLVSIPTDINDNPLIEGTEVSINFQFLNSIEKNVEETDHLMAWKNLFSPDKSGRVLVNSASKGISSKEITAEIFPDNAVDFTINSERSHRYADANQITTFYTSIIRDQFENIVSDGTHVDFFIQCNNNSYLKTSGNTINGIAKAKMIHPDQEETWTVKAYIHGISESNTIQLSFVQLFNDFNVEFSDNNRLISIGVLKSFMDQLIPDGFPVELSIFKNDTLIDTKKELSRKGMLSFKLKKDFYPNGEYKLVLKTGGNQKVFENIHLKD